MKAVILAAGNGERLRPLTDTVPKCLLLVRGVPMLRIWLDVCRRNHINDVLVNTHAHAHLVDSYLSEHGSGFRLKVTHEEQLLGSAGTLLANRDWIGCDDDFWVFYGDVLTDVRLERMLEFHRHRRPIATIGVYEVSNPMQCGIVCVDEHDTVKEFVEKPTEPNGNLAFSGVMIGTPALLDEIPRQAPMDLGFHVLPKLCGRIAAYRIPEYLVDIGTPSAYQHAQLSWPGLRIAA
jgi:mannose-1-phosphate guanylyltransferase